MSFKTSLNPTVYPVMADKILAALGAIPAAALLTPCKLCLYANDIAVSRHTQLSDLQAPTFTGYAPAAIAALTGPVNLDENSDGMTAEASFKATAAPTSSEVIYGYYVTDNADAELLIAERFDVPVPIVESGDFCSVQLVFPEPFGRSWSGD